VVRRREVSEGWGGAPKGQMDPSPGEGASGRVSKVEVKLPSEILGEWLTETQRKGTVFFSHESTPGQPLKVDVPGKTAAQEWVYHVIAPSQPLGMTPGGNSSERHIGEPFLGLPEKLEVSRSQHMPPQKAEKILMYLLPHSALEPLIGDLREWFGMIEQEHGLRFAQHWYFRQAAGAVFHLLGARVAKLASVGAVLKLGRRLLGG
jgi:hypothetical protein